MNVLIVDDDKLARKGLVAIMDWEKYGFEVVGDVQNGRKASGGYCIYRYRYAGN